MARFSLGLYVWVRHNSDCPQTDIFSHRCRCPKQIAGVAHDDVRGPLATVGYRVIVPYLRCFGPTVFRSPDIFRSGLSQVFRVLGNRHVVQCFVAESNRILAVPGSSRTRGGQAHRTDRSEYHLAALA
jgi:hypothetical protein